jgi:hypothetical protein
MLDGAIYQKKDLKNKINIYVIFSWVLQQTLLFLVTCNLAYLIIQKTYGKG